jgi:hypothetical protein
MIGRALDVPLAAVGMVSTAQQGSKIQCHWGRKEGSRCRAHGEVSSSPEECLDLCYRMARRSIALSKPFCQGVSAYQPCLVPYVLDLQETSQRVQKRRLLPEVRKGCGTRAKGKNWSS